MIQKILTKANEHMNNYIKNQLGDKWSTVYFGERLVNFYYKGYKFSVRFYKDVEFNYPAYGSFTLMDTDRLEYLQGMTTFANSPKMIEGLKEIRDMYAEQLKKYEEEA